MSFTLEQTRAVGAILRAAAQSEILPRFRTLDPHSIRHKSSQLDLVTDADEAAEAHIADALHAMFPRALVAGEESVCREPNLLDHVSDAPLAFVVDPIDGTKNFASGLPLFGVMAAVLEHGEVVAGVIYDPVVDDWSIAARGEGAWLESADGRSRRLQVARAQPVKEMTGIVSWLFMAEPLRSTVTRNLACVAAGVDYRTAAHEYRLLASGHYHFALFGKLAPWDHLPGLLLHRESGGFAACLDGAPYALGIRAEGLLCAPDQASWQSLRDALTRA